MSKVTSEDIDKLYEAIDKLRDDLNYKFDTLEDKFSELDRYIERHVSSMEDEIDYLKKSRGGMYQ